MRILASILTVVLAVAAGPVAAKSPRATTGEAEVLPIDLPTALRLAGAQNLDVRIAREKLAEAQANEESALWQFFPWIAPGFTYRRHTNLTQAVDGSIIDADKEQYTVGPSLMAQVDLGDALFKRLSAKQAAKAAEFAVESQRQDSVWTAALAFFELVKTQASVDVAQEAVSIAQDYGQQIDRAVSAGVAFKGDALRAQAQIERNRTALLQAIEQKRLASARLVQVLHLKGGISLVASHSGTTTVEVNARDVSLGRLLAQALERRAELKQSEALELAAEASRKGAVYGPLIPTVGGQIFGGGLGGGIDGGDHRFGESEDYQFSIGWRIGPGGLFDRGRIHAAEARARTATLTKERLIDQISREVTEAHVRLESLGQQLDTTRKAEEASKETLRLTRERKEFAVGAVLETIQAEQDLTRARLDRLAAVAEYNKAQYSLRRAVGGDSELKTRRSAGRNK